MTIRSVFYKSFLVGVVALIASLFFLTHLLDLEYRLPLKSVAKKILPELSLEHREVLVSAKVLTATESKQCFGHDLPGRGIDALELTIQNNTPREYSVSASAVDLPRVEAKDIAFRITKSSLPRSIAYRMASVFFWPFAIPGTIDSIKTLLHHRQIKKDFISKSLRDEVIAPYATYHRVLFVPQHHIQECVDVTLIDLDTLAPHTMAVHVS